MSSHAQTRGGVVIVGAGPGVSGSLARLYAEAGHSIGLVGIDPDVLEALATELAAYDVEVRVAEVDITDTAVASAAIADLGRALAPVDVLHFNPSAFREADPLELGVDQLLADVALGVGALLTALQAVHPFMASGSRVSATGSMAADVPWSRAPSLGIQKAGLRNLVTSIDGTLKDQGIRAVSVTVRGTLATTGAFTPDRVAAAILAATRQDPSEWRTEVPYEG